jgi:hypothetical protein
VRDTTGKGFQTTAPRQGCQSSATLAGVGFSGMYSALRRSVAEPAPTLKTEQAVTFEGYRLNQGGE